MTEFHQLREVEQSLAAIADRRIPHAEAVNLGKERDVLIDRQIAVQAEALGQVSDRLRDLEMLTNGIASKNPHGSAVGFQQTAYQPNRRRLACAVRTDEAEHLAL